LGRKSSQVRRRWYRDVYLHSDHWKAFKKEYRRLRPWKCGKCDATKQLQLHHLTYARLWREELDDVVPLCPYHHEEEHAGKYKRKNSPISSYRVEAWVPLKAQKEGAVEQRI
jgi:hypothetical protein